MSVKALKRIKTTSALGDKPNGKEPPWLRRVAEVLKISVPEVSPKFLECNYPTEEDTAENDGEFPEDQVWAAWKAGDFCLGSGGTYVINKDTFTPLKTVLRAYKLDLLIVPMDAKFLKIIITPDVEINSN